MKQTSNNFDSMTEFDTDNMKRTVMRRVYVVFWWRRVKNFFPASVVPLAAFTAVAAYFVSLPHVAQNLWSASSDIQALYHFLVAAFTNTTFVAQILAMGVLLSGLFFLKDISHRLMIKYQDAFLSKRLA